MLENDLCSFWTAVVAPVTECVYARAARFAALAEAVLAREGAAAAPAADDTLPTSATCTNRLTLPAYSSRAVLDARLRYAIASCPSIDADIENTDRSAFM